MRPLFTLPGGSFNQRDEILEVLPEPADGQRYVEPFAGAASVFFGRDPVDHEVLNDKNTDLIKFYSCFRNMDPGEIDCDLSPDEDRIQRLRENGVDSSSCQHHVCDFLYLQKRSFGGQGNGSFSMQSAEENADRCSDAGPETCGASDVLENPEKFQARLEDVDLRTHDFAKAISDSDGPDTVFYVDPPYSEDVACRYEDMNEPVGEKNRDLCAVQPADVKEALQDTQGDWVLTYDAADEVLDLFDYDKYHVQTLGTRRTMSKGDNAQDADELLITNFDPADADAGQQAAIAAATGQAATGQAAPTAGGDADAADCGEVWERVDRHDLDEAAPLAWEITQVSGTEVGRRACSDGAEADICVSRDEDLGCLIPCPPGTRDVGDVHTHPAEGGGRPEFSGIDIPSMTGRLDGVDDPVSCIVHPGDGDPQLQCAAPDTIPDGPAEELVGAWDAYVETGNMGELAAVEDVSATAREEMTICERPLADFE